VSTEADIGEDVQSTLVVKHPPRNKEGLSPVMVYWTEYSPRKEIKVLGPDVNRSYYQFEVEGKNIRVGLTSIKGLALKTAEKVIEEMSLIHI